MSTSRVRFEGAAALVVSMLAGCATPSTDPGTAPSAVDDDIAALSTQSYGGFTIAPSTPTGNVNDPNDYSDDTVTATLVVTGSGTSIKMGSCLLSKVFIGDTGPVVCSSASDCSYYASGIAGSEAVCTHTDGSSNNYCYIRPGTPASLCMGSPANGGNVIGAGTYPLAAPVWAYAGWPAIFDYRPDYDAYGYQAGWINYGCFSGCVAPQPGPPTTPALSGGRTLQWFYNNGTITDSAPTYLD